MPFDLLTVLPTRLDIKVNDFNGGVLNDVPSAYHWYTKQFGVKKCPAGYKQNIISQGEYFIRCALYLRSEGRGFTTHRIKITYQPLPFSIYSPGYYLILSLARL